jgi:hypothetical protein
MQIFIARSGLLLRKAVQLNPAQLVRHFNLQRDEAIEPVDDVGQRQVRPSISPRHKHQESKPLHCEFHKYISRQPNKRSLTIPRF